MNRDKNIIVKGEFVHKLCRQHPLNVLKRIYPFVLSMQNSDFNGNQKNKLKKSLLPNRLANFSNNFVDMILSDSLKPCLLVKKCSQGLGLLPYMTMVKTLKIFFSESILPI